MYTRSSRSDIPFVMHPDIMEMIITTDTENEMNLFMTFPHLYITDYQ